MPSSVPQSVQIAGYRSDQRLSCHWEDDEAELATCKIDLSSWGLSILGIPIDPILLWIQIGLLPVIQCLYLVFQSSRQCLLQHSFRNMQLTLECFNPTNEQRIWSDKYTTRTCDGAWSRRYRQHTHKHTHTHGQWELASERESCALHNSLSHICIWMPSSCSSQYNNVTNQNSLNAFTLYFPQTILKLRN